MSKSPPAHEVRPPVSGRTVEITDEDESMVIAFLPVGPKTVLPTAPNQQRKENYDEKRH